MNNNNVLHDSVQTVAEITLDHKRKFLKSNHCHIFEDAMVAIPMIAFPRVRTIYIYIYNYNIYNY